MKTVASLAVLTAIVSSGMTASGQDERPFHEIAEDLGIDLEPASGGGIPEESLRPLDDSDPEARARVEHFFASTPCGDVLTTGGVCDEALAILREGGDRLATYLIRQVEQNEAEGFPNQATYLRLLGSSESAVAVPYLQALVEKRAEALRRGELEREAYLHAIEALGRTRSPVVAETALGILEGSDDPQVQLRAINALDRVQAKHGAVPGAAARIEAVKQMNAQREQAIRGTAPAGSGSSLGVASPWEEVQQRFEKVLRSPGHTR